MIATGAKKSPRLREWAAAVPGLIKILDGIHPATPGSAAQGRQKKCLGCRHYDSAELICRKWKALTLPENPTPQDCYARKFRIPGKVKGGWHE